MNIILACDDKFVPFCSVVISSTIKYNDNVSFYIFTEGLTDKSISSLRKLVDGTSNTISVKVVDKEIIKRFPLPKGEGLSHISVATYFRLFSTELLPELDKAIYLDCDILVRGSLKELWNTDMGANYLAAVYHPNSLSVNNGAFNRLDIPISQGYFNAGVLLMNLKKWKEDGIYQKCMDFIRDKYANIRNHDQDVLNAVCGKHTLILSCKWNMQNIFYKVRFWYKTNDPYNKRYQSELGNAKDVITKSVIVHFAARPKPWEWYCTHPLRKEFLAELKSNGFRLKQREWSNWPGFWGHLKATLMGFGRYNGRCYPKSSVWHWVIPILNFLTERKKSKMIWD